MTADERLDYHPVTGDYNDLTNEELAMLRESLRNHGLRVPVVIWQGQVVDGRHRVTLCRELGIDVHFDDITDRCPTEAEMRAHVRALNEHRRANTKPLTTAEKRARIKIALKVNPDVSNRQIADDLGVSKTTVSDVRSGLESTGQIGQLDGTVGKDKKRRRKPTKPPEAHTATDEQIDASNRLFANLDNWRPFPPQDPVFVAFREWSRGVQELADNPAPENVVAHLRAKEGDSRKRAVNGIVNELSRLSSKIDWLRGEIADLARPAPAAPQSPPDKRRQV